MWGARNPDALKTCSLSERVIAVPNRTFSIQNDQETVDYDIYRLALHLLRQNQWNFPGPDKEFVRFAKAFNLTPLEFTGLWGKDRSMLLNLDIAKDNVRGDLPNYPEALLASTRVNLFAYIISSSRRDVLKRYTDEISTPEDYKKAMNPKMQTHTHFNLM